MTSENDEEGGASYDSNKEENESEVDLDGDDDLADLPYVPVCRGDQGPVWGQGNFGSQTHGQSPGERARVCQSVAWGRGSIWTCRLVPWSQGRPARGARVNKAMVRVRGGIYHG